MIKKCLKVLCILWLTLLPISFSSAAVYTWSIPWVIYNTSMPNYPFTNEIDRNLNFVTNSELNNFFYTADCSITSDCRGARSWILFRNNGKLAWYGNVNIDEFSTHSVIIQWYYNSYCSSNLSNFASYCINWITTAWNYTTSIDNFYSLGAIYDSYYFNNDARNRPYLCFLSNSRNLASCFTINITNNSNAYNWYISWSYILTSNGNNLTDFSSESVKFWSSAFKWNSYTPWDTQVVNTDLDRYIDYYETRFWRNKNMCYVGTTDFTTPYWSWNLSFIAGTWYTLNEFYYKLYGTFWSNNIKNVWSFINSWLINYSQWFYEWKQYLVNYNWPDTNISVYYDNLTFPFENKPVAIYFMATNLLDYYSVESTQGEEMAYYCQMKTNYQFYKENPDLFKEDVESKVWSWINERVQDYYNTHIGWGTWKVGFQVPNLSGTVWGELWKWNELPEGLQPTDLFKDFFTKVTTLTEGFSPSQNWILPDWILYPLIFLVLFRIFRH